MNEQDGHLIPRRSDLLPAAVQVSGPPDTAEVPSAAEQPQLLFQPQMDIYETDDGLVLYADLPGVTLDGLELQVQDKKLTLFGRVRQPADEIVQILHQEYQIGHFFRSFILSDDVDHDRIEARLTNGVLRVSLPRAERAKPRRIEVAGS
ncbi:MAG: Hsp20/alpha crystallin family protein [Planctomyces sp.]|jgi:HSP20 family protein